MINVKQVSLATVLIALGVVIATFLSFPVMDSKAFPGQHMINGLAGVLLGPVWAGFIAFCIGIIRMGLGVGTIFSMPGGIPGAVVVGLVYMLSKRMGKKHFVLAALSEPMFLIPVWLGWSLSCILGAIFSVIILETLRRTGLIERILE
jgi:energy coupling factor transporter S component ThiW